MPVGTVGAVKTFSPEELECFNSQIVLGATAGNIVTVNVPQTDITGITYGDTNGVRSLNLPYLAKPTTAGNNELTLVMT